LQAAEAALADVLGRNARYDQLPNLMELRGRLQRRTGPQQAVCGGLVQAYEKARINVWVAESP
jgi:hypothetical protein